MTVFLPSLIEEEVQNRALRIFYLLMHYNEALIESGVETCGRRKAVCMKRLTLILGHPNHRLMS